MMVVPCGRSRRFVREGRLSEGMVIEHLTKSDMSDLQNELYLYNSWQSLTMYRKLQQWHKKVIVVINVHFLPLSIFSRILSSFSKSFASSSSRLKEALSSTGSAAMEAFKSARSTGTTFSFSSRALRRF